MEEFDFSGYSDEAAVAAQPAGDEFDFSGYVDEGSAKPKGALGQFGSALTEGFSTMARNVGASYNAVTGDNQGIVDSAKAQAIDRANTGATEMAAFERDLSNRARLSDDDGFLQSLKNVGGAIAENKTGAAQMLVNQVPNALPAIGGGLAGAKVGAIAGAAGGPIGSIVGGIVGGIAGMYLGNTSIEVGAKAVEKVKDGALSDEDRSAAVKEGAVKGAFITGADALTLGASRYILGTAARAADRAAVRVLSEAGVDASNHAAVAAALKNPAVSTAVKQAATKSAEDAARAASTMPKKAGRAAAVTAVEGAGEGVGELSGEYAATGKLDYQDAILEAIMGVGQSAVEIPASHAFSKIVGQKREAYPQVSDAQPPVSPDFVARAFTDVGGAGETVNELRQARGLVAASLSQMDDQEAAQAVSVISGGNEQLAQQLLQARQDQELIQAGRTADGDNIEPFMAVNHMIRADAGLAQHGEGDQEAVTQFLSQRFPTVFAQQAPQTASGVTPTSSAFFPATPAAPFPTNAPTSEPVPQLQAQIQAVRDGRKPAVVIGVQDVGGLDVNGLAHGIAKGPDGAEAYVFAPTNEAVNAVVTRAFEVGVPQATGEILGYAQPGLTEAAGVPSAAVQQIDNATGQILQDEIVTPDAAGNVNRIPDTSVRVAPVAQILAEREGALGVTRGEGPVAQQMSQSAAETPVLAQSTAVESAPSTPAPGIRAQAPAKNESTAVSTAVPRSKPVFELVKRLNAANRLEGASAINEASIVEVDPNSIKDKGEQRRMRQLKDAVKAAFGVDLIVVDTPSGSLMRKDGTKFNTFIGVADQEAKRVFINRKAATPLNTMAHELVHVMETSFPEAYAKLEDSVLSRVQYGSFRSLKAGLEAALAAESKGSSDAQRLMAELRSEIVAEAVGEMGQSPQLWLDVFSGMKDQTQVKKLYDAIIEIIGKLAKAFTKEGYIDGLKDMQAVRKAVTEAFVQWSVKENQGTAVSEAQPASKPTDMSRQKGESDKEFAKRVVDKRPKPKSLPEDHGAYFTLPAGTVIVPIDKIASTKSDAENEQGAENGVKRMAAAAAGELSKRPPITVMPSETVEGGYDIVDGNGSYSSIKPYGWKTLPVIVVPRKKGKRAIKIDKAKELAEKHLPKPLVKEMVAAVEAVEETPDNPAFLAKKDEAEAFMKPLLEKAAEANTAYQGDVSKIAEEIGAKAKSGPLKKLDRAAYKLWEDSWLKGVEPASDMIKDIVRASIVVDTETEVAAAVEAVRSKFNVIRLKDRFAKPLSTGYRDILINVQLENGSIAELQIHIPEIYDAKELGHIVYEAERQMPEGSDAQVALQKLQKRYYDAAYALALGRASRSATKTSNSSGVAGAPFSTMRENRTGTPDKASLNQEQSTAPTTGMPSKSNSPTPGLAASALQSNPDISNTSEGSVLRKGSGVYVSRPVLNGDMLHAWAKSVGIKDVVPADKMHVTLAYSKTPVDRDALKAKIHPLIVSKGERSLEQFDDGAVVLRIDSAQLQGRWKELIDAGATWDFGHYKGAYKPHVTLSYEKQDVDLGKIKPYSKPIVLAGEKAEDLKTNYSEEIKAEIDKAPDLVKFSRKDIVKAINGDLSGNPMEFLGEPTEAMRRYGILGRTLPVAIVPKVINKIGTGKDIGRGSNRTPMTPEQIESLPGYVKTPAAVFDDPTDKDSLVFMTSMVMDDTDPVVVAIGKRPINDQLPVKMIGGAMRKTAFSNVNTAHQKSWDKFGSWVDSGDHLKMVDPEQVEAAVNNGMPKRLARSLREAALKSKGRVYVVGGSAALDRIAYPVTTMTGSGVKQQPSELPSTTAKPTVALQAGSVNPATGKKILGAKKTLAQRGSLSTVDIMSATDEVARASLGLNPTPKRGDGNGVREIATALNRRTIFSAGIMDDENTSQGAANKLAEAMADEVRYQLSTTASTGTGLGWYSNNYPKALDRLSARFPELKTDRRARAIFTAFVAVTSNGEKVNKNISNAVELYSDFRVGRNPEAMGNRRATALENNLKAIEDLVSRFGIDGFERALMEETTVGRMNAELTALGKKTNSSYTADTVVPWAAVYFGPKLGAFYANLMGAEGYLTMDLWWTRTINRMRGLLIPKATDSSLFNFRQLIGEPGLTREETIAASVGPRNTYEEYGFTTELEFLVGSKEPDKAGLEEWMTKARRRAGSAFEAMLLEHKTEKFANTIYKNEFEMLKEAPFRATDRSFMYSAARRAQQLLRDTGTDLSLADIQAALWYYEKRLYQKLSGRRADDIGYEEAIIAQAGEGSGPAGPATRFNRGPDNGNEPQRADQEADRVQRSGEEKGEGRGQALADSGGRPARDIADANTKRISIGLAPGEGSRLSGEIPSARALEIVNDLAQLSGAKILKTEVGVGAYMQYMEGSIQVDASASPEVIKDFMDMLGYAMQQTEIIATHPTKSGTRMAIDISAPQLKDITKARQFFDAFLKKQAEYGGVVAPGFQQTADGLRLLNFDGKWEDQQLLSLYDAMIEAAEETGVEIADAVAKNVTLESTKNDWTKETDGASYLGSLRDRGRLQEVGQLVGRYGSSRLDLRFSRADVAGSAEPAGRSDQGGRESQRKGAEVAGAVHYGKTGFLSNLSGQAFGSGIKGEEKGRLSQPGVDPRIKRRVYFYLPVEGGIPAPEVGLGSHVYKANLDGLYDPDGTVTGAGNALETAILDAGYRGYINREQGTAVVLNEDVPVEYMGTSDGKVKVPRRIERIKPAVQTRTEGAETVRRMDNPVSLKAKQEAQKSAPSFRLEYGEARVATTEKDAANKALEAAGSGFRFSRAIKDDIEAQAKWLDGKAKSAGYKDIDALAEADYDQFVELAQEWRQDHPADALFSRPLKVMSAQEVVDMARTGKMPYNLDDAIRRGQLADAYTLSKDASQRSQLLGKIGDWAIETFADSMISVRRWIDRLPLSATLKQRMTGDLYRAATLRSTMQKEVKERFTEPMFREMEKVAKATGMTSDQVKVLSGYWMTAKYAPKANAFLLAKDNTALMTAMQTGDPALIAQAQQNVADRTADMNGVIGAPRKRGVAGGFNNAEAAQTMQSIEAKIPRQMLDDISRHVYDMLAWKKAKDLQSGRISQTMVNSWPNHRDYVPLTGDPRFNPESEDVFTTGGQLNQDRDKAINGRKESISDDAVDATYEAVVKSINFSAIQDFKRSLAKAYNDAKAAGIDIGLKQEPVTGIIRNSDDVVIYRDTVTNPNGLSTTEAKAFRFDDKKVIQALKRENEEQLNALLSAVATPTRWYGKLVTQFMPMFAPINYIRDMWERSELIRTRKLFDANGNQIDTDKVARKAIAASLSPQLWRGSLASNFGTQAQSQERSDLEEMIRLGGSSVWGDYLARNAGDIEAELRTSFGKVAGAARTANRAVENYNNVFEMIAPLSIYRALKAEGMEAKDAAAAVLDLMNFKKRGVAMPAVRAMYVFAQPAATSGYNLAQYLSTRKGQIRFAAQLLVGAALYAFLKGLWGDDEDELGSRLDNLSNFTVERTIPIPVGDKVVKVPVGFGAPQLAWAAAGIFNRLASGRYDTPTAVGELFKGWVKSVSPVAPSDMEIAKNPAAWAAMSFTPTVLRPLASIAMNQTPFGQPLRPQFLNPDKFRSDQAKRTTPQLYKDIAAEVREMTGVDMYPDNIKAMVDGWLVGPARELTSFFIENPAKELRGEPGKVVGISSVLDNVNDRQLLNSMYYRAKEDAEETHREYEARLKDGTLMDWITPEKMTQVSAYKRMEQVERRMGSLRGQLTKQSRFMDPEAVAGRTQQIEDQVDQARRGLLKEMQR